MAGPAPKKQFVSRATRQECQVFYFCSSGAKIGYLLRCQGTVGLKPDYRVRLAAEKVAG
jgi:hypothetical protein